MKIDSNYNVLNQYSQNFSKQNTEANVAKNLISPPYKIELSEPAKKIIISSSGKENISTINQFGTKKISDYKEDFRQEMIRGINNVIGEVLEPYETYEGSV